MSGYDIAFYICSALTLFFGVMVILRRDPVNAAMSLVLCIASMAGLFVLLRAYFLAAVQVLVYAGAVMVLFLFVIMLLDLKEEVRRRMKVARGFTGALAVLAVLALIVNLIWTGFRGANLPPATVVGATAPLGRLLFERFVLPFEIFSLLLLVAMLGVILLSKKELK